jgi:uncharacterized protein DUF4158
MPRRSILSAAERDSLLAMPDTKGEVIRHFTFNETDLSIIRQHRGPANRLGFAVQLCYPRFPGIVLGVDEPPFPPLLCMVATQLKVPVEHWDEYGQRACRKPAAADGHPARHERHRARQRRGHHTRQPAHLCGTDQGIVGTPLLAPGRTAQAQGRQQDDVAGLAASVARQAEFAAHARTH